MSGMASGGANPCRYARPNCRPKKQTHKANGPNEGQGGAYTISYFDKTIILA